MLLDLRYFWDPGEVVSVPVQLDLVPLPTFIPQIDELTSASYLARLRDQFGNPVPASTLSGLTLTLYDATTGAIINNRDDQDVLNANDVTVGEDGLITWDIQIQDTPVLNDTPSVITRNSQGDRIEVHKALFRASWDGNTKVLNKLVTLNIVAFDKL